MNLHIQKIKKAKVIAKTLNLSTLFITINKCLTKRISEKKGVSIEEFDTLKYLCRECDRNNCKKEKNMRKKESNYRIKYRIFNFR